MGRAKMKDWMMDNAYLMTLGCVIAVVLGCALYTKALKETDVQAAAGAPEIAMSMQPTATPRVTPLPTIAPLTLRPMTMERGGAWPIGGGIVRAYDAQRSVYWEALGAWQAHMGVDIAGTAGEAVIASMDGTVESAVLDALWGWRVCIRHDYGREMCYAGLESCVVQPGMRVRRGETMGTLMESIPCEAELGTHLHVEMLRDGKHQDPEATLEER